ncbi:hypothetical protein Tco_0320149 [Tanacetum coccineum]
MALPPRYQRHRYLRFEGLGYTDVNITDFEERLGKIYDREIHRVQVFDFGGLIDLMDEGLSGPLVHELILEFFSMFRFGEVVLDLDTTGALQLQLRGLRRHIRISSTGDFLGTAPSYTSIRDLMIRLYHRLIACNIVGRSQEPEKVTVTDLFYLRGRDVGSFNIPYLLVRYLRMFASGRKREAMISGRQIVARLAKHFGLLTEERLQGLAMIVQDLLMIDMAKLVRLQICKELDDTWAWVAPRPERQPDVAVGTQVVVEGAPNVDEGAQTVLAPIQAPQPSSAAGPARTMAHRLGRLEEDIHGLRGALGEQREVRILQRSQENGQNRTNTDTGTERVQKSQKIAINGQHSQLLVNPGQTCEVKTPKYPKQSLIVNP